MRCANAVQPGAPHRGPFLFNPPVLVLGFVDGCLAWSGASAGLSTDVEAAAGSEVGSEEEGWPGSKSSNVDDAGTW